ncbi:MAG: hypothetical protein ACOC7V_15230 [Spirochaetota bacterium]
MLPTLSIGLWSLVAPTDPRALLAATVSWNLDRGLMLLAAARGNVGDAGSTCDPDSVGSPTFTLGVRYSF